MVARDPAQPLCRQKTSNLVLFGFCLGIPLTVQVSYFVGIMLFFCLRDQSRIYAFGIPQIVVCPSPIRSEVFPAVPLESIPSGIYVHFFFRLVARRLISAVRSSALSASQNAREATRAPSLRCSGVITSARRFPPILPAFRVSIAAILARNRRATTAYLLTTYSRSAMAVSKLSKEESR